jgi:hypothetical protein
MKTLKSYVLLIIIGLLTFNSCNQEESQVHPGTDLKDQVGYWHNNAIASLFNNPDFIKAAATGSLSHSDIREIIMLDLSKKDPQLFNYESIRTELAWSDVIIAENGIIPGLSSAKIMKQDGDPINCESVFQYLHELNEIGENLKNALIELNKKVISGEVSRNEIIKLSSQMRDLPLSDKEKSYVDVFNQVLYASNHYWENTHARVQDKRTLGIIWADAAGGLYGMLCGPICSIIEAALFSTIVAIQ